jgi:hypothetical protein
MKYARRSSHGRRPQRPSQTKCAAVRTAKARQAIQPDVTFDAPQRRLGHPNASTCCCLSVSMALLITSLGTRAPRPCQTSRLRYAWWPVLGVHRGRVASGKRRTFADGEAKLSEWVEENAFACWMETPEPWTIETELITSVCLPLNLEQNRNHPFHPTLSELRATAKRQADEPADTLNGATPLVSQYQRP